MKSETRSLINEMLEFIAPEVDELGSQREMAHIERILREGTGAERQLAVWEVRHELKDVVDQIVAETYESLKVAPEAATSGSCSAIAAVIAAETSGAPAH